MDALRHAARSVAPCGRLAAQCNSQLPSQAAAMPGQRITRMRSVRLSRRVPGFDLLRAASSPEGISRGGAAIGTVITANREKGHQKDGLKRLILRLTMAPAKYEKTLRNAGTGKRDAIPTLLHRIGKPYPSYRPGRPMVEPVINYSRNTLTVRSRRPYLPARTWAAPRPGAVLPIARHPLRASCVLQAAPSLPSRPGPQPPAIAAPAGTPAS